MSRESMLARIRQAAETGRAYRVHLPEIDHTAGRVGAGDDPPAWMAAEVDAVGGQAHLVENMSAAREVLENILAELDPQLALCWQHPLLDELRLEELLATRKIEQLKHAGLSQLSPEECRRQMLAADIGISSVEYAVAETGTLVVCSKPGRERLASLAPPVHVAIVSASQILPDLFDLFDRLGVDGLPSNLALITGPSKTGDIELQLTTGVHGPGTWHVIIIRN
jgi:L-lactate dehydrogenase complex protein LldG